MKYRGFREEPLLAAARELEALGLMPSEVHAILNLAGAKWRSVQIREGRDNEYQDQNDALVFHKATTALMKSTMPVTQELALLAHSSEGEKFMLLAIGVTMGRLFERGSPSIREWLREGDARTRKVILSFAIGSSIIVEPQAIDGLMYRIVKLRYGAQIEASDDISDAVLGVVESLGNSGYACLKPIRGAAT